jgi:hypothetical protein
MAWEDRNGRSYYYRKERRGGRVVSEYVGSGKTARLLATLDALQRIDKEEALELKRSRLAADAERDAALDDLREVCETLTRATLIAEGFHTHKRQWRRARWQRQ